MRLAILSIVMMLVLTIIPLTVADYEDYENSKVPKTVQIPYKTLERLCSRMGNWTYAQYSHEWWAKYPDNYHLLYNLPNVDLAWAKIYYDQVTDLREICP